MEWADEHLSKKWSGVDGVYGLDGVDTPQTVVTKRAPAVQTKKCRYGVTLREWLRL